jgi:SAM-dependent methyltransferase
MLRPRSSPQKLALALSVLFAVVPGHARKNNLPAVRWIANAPGCEFQRGDDGRYRWRFVGDDLDMTLLMDSQELSKSQRRLYKPLGVYLTVTYTGPGKFEFPADLRMEFVRHHNVIEGYLDPTEFSTKMQNDVDTLVFDTEREIKKHPEKAEEKTTRAREFQKEVSEFIEFLSTQSLEPAILNPGNPEVHGWVFFGTKNKWLGPWKSREDFILRVWMKDKVYEFPFSLPPTEGDLILRKRDQ